jgi:predicted adenylyl cyclase CyaB
MARNIEIKARIDDPVACAARAAALADRGPTEIQQDDTFFRCIGGRLKLRAFSDGTGELIYYRRANSQGPKESFYLRSPTTAPNELRELLTLANGQAGRVKKHRKLFLVGRTRIHIDEVEHLGHFLELEVVLADEEPLEIGVSEAHGLIKRLGILPHQLVEEAYVDLLALTGLSEAAVAAVAAVTSVMPPGATGPLGASAPADPTGAAT